MKKELFNEIVFVKKILRKHLAKAVWLDPSSVGRLMKWTESMSLKKAEDILIKTLDFIEFLNKKG